MHSGGGGAEAPTWDGGEAGPLKEEPTLYDFEVQLYPGALGLDDYDDNDGGGGLRSFSPDFEIDNGSGGEEECVREEGGVWASSFGDVSITSPRKWAQSPSNSHLPVQPRLAPLIMWGQPQGGQCGTGVGGHASHSHSPSPELQYPSSCDIIPFPTSTSVRTSTRHHQRAPTTLATVASSYVAHHQSAMPIGQSTGPLSHHQQSPQSQIDTWHHPQSTNADHSSHHHMHDHGSAVVPAEAYVSTCPIIVVFSYGLQFLITCADLLHLGFEFEWADTGTGRVCVCRAWVGVVAGHRRRVLDATEPEGGEYGPIIRVDSVADNATLTKGGSFGPIKLGITSTHITARAHTSYNITTHTESPAHTPAR